MNLKTRRLVFLSLLVFFLVAGAYLVLSAQGMVLDIKNFRIVKTGGLFLKYSPADAAVLIDGEKPDAAPTGLFSSGIIVRNLSPGRYRTEVAKTGFKSWRKELEVKSGFITSASQIMLLPDELETEEVATEEIKKFYPTAKGLVFEDRGGKLSLEDIPLKGSKVVLNDPESKILVTEDKKVLFLTDLDAPASAVNLNQLFNSLKQRQLGLPGEVPIAAVLTHPFTPLKVLISTQKSLYSLDFRKLTLERLVSLERIVGLAKGSNEFFLWDGEILSTVNLLLKTKSSYPLVTEAGSKLMVSKSGRRVTTLDEEGNLYLYERPSATSTLIAEKVQDVSFSPEEKRAALTKTDGSLEILYLDDHESDVLHRAGERSIILPSGTASGIRNVSWFPKTTNHLAAILNENLWVSETDDRDRINSAEIAKDIEGYALYGNKLYFLKSGKILAAPLDWR